MRAAPPYHLYSRMEIKTTIKDTGIYSGRV